MGANTQFFRTGSLRVGPCSSCLCWAGGLRHEFVEFGLWKRLGADDNFLHSESDKHKHRNKQRTELDGVGSDEYCHRAGDIHVHIGKWFDEYEPNGDDQLHVDSNECRRIDHVYANRYRKHGRHTNDQLIHS